jgi:hypothetical protein
MPTCQCQCQCQYAKVGSDNTHLEQIMGQHRLGDKQNWKMFVDICAQNWLVINMSIKKLRTLRRMYKKSD